jgi:DNA (cytosine-5)-methyltransferase 1
LIGEILAREIAAQTFGKESSAAPTLAVPRSDTIPEPEPCRSVPEKYLHLVGEHEAHPGTGKGRSYRTGTYGQQHKFNMHGESTR